MRDQAEHEADSEAVGVGARRCRDAGGVISDHYRFEQLTGGGALEPEHVVPGHGEPAGPEALETARRYIETVVELAALPGDHEVPAELAGWEFAEGFRQNIAALRAR
ncbi:MAG TPA: hypothetical protein VH816_18350 [Gaiellaceae bacterium]